MRARCATVGGAVVVLVLLAPLLGATAVGATEIRIEDAYPLAGRATVIEVRSHGEPVAGARVEVLYRPNSEAASRATLGTTDGAGRIPWVPTDAGLARITARAPDATDESRLDVAIRWGRMPRAGLLILVVAAVLLFGGAALGLVLVARDSTPPST